MDKEEEEEKTRELLLPNWQGSGSMGITLDKNEEGVFVKQLVQDSPAGKTGVAKEGDQIVGATLYFDNMSSEDIERLLTNVGHHTVGLKLQRKGDRSPQPGMTWSHDVFSSKSPDVVLSGDDEEYRRIYTKKIKPRLKSDETLEPETQTRTITVTRKVTAYTVDVTGSKGTKEIDISSPEYKIKIPRHEITEISKTNIDTEEGKTVIKIPGADISGRTFEFGKEINLEATGPGVSLTGGTQSISSSSVYSQVTNAGTFGLHGIHSDGNISISSPSVSGPKYQSYEQQIDVKSSTYEAAQKGHLRSPQDSSIDIQMKGSILKGAEAGRAGRSTINTEFASTEKTFGISKGGFQSSTIMLKETRFDMQKPGGFTVEQSDISVKVPQADINLPVSGKKETAGELKLHGPATAINVASPDTQAALLQKDGKIQSAGIKLKESNFDISSLKAEAPDVADTQAALLQKDDSEQYYCWFLSKHCRNKESLETAFVVVDRGPLSCQLLIDPQGTGQQEVTPDIEVHNLLSPHCGQRFEVTLPFQKAQNAAEFCVRHTCPNQKTESSPAQLPRCPPFLVTLWNTHIHPRA